MNKSYFSLPYKLDEIPINDDTDIRYPPSFAQKFIEAYTKPGEVVFDPFAGFGTTLLVAQELDRVGIGIEYEAKRAKFIAGQLEAPSKIIHGSALELENYDLPKFDLSLTSPPYMRYFDRENPFSNYHQEGSYQGYLRDISKIYTQVKRLMNPGARVVLEVSNTFEEGRPMTPLAWDIARVLSDILFFEREVVFLHEVEHEALKTQHSYCLIFSNDTKPHKA